MNTSLPLLNVITGSQAATGSRSGNPADTADVPFNQVLNSQVNTRVQDNQAGAPGPAERREPGCRQAAAASQSAAAQQSQSASANAGAASKSAAGDGSDKSSQVSDKDEGEDSTDTTTQASAELLALVANIAQNAVTPADGKAKGESSEADLLAQAKRGGKMSLADQQQALADEKQGKVDPAALQDALATARSKQDAAASELASKRNAEANPAPQPACQGWKSGD
jgi:flagellar hook-length control protein FliK